MEEKKIINNGNYDKTRRGRGRPASGEGSNQRKKILVKSRKVFAEKGYDATSIQAIADRVGVDRRLVYHYFKSKRCLYLEVMVEIFDQLEKIAANLLIISPDIETFCDKLIRKLYGYCVEHQELLRLLMWENQKQNASLAAIRENKMMQKSTLSNPERVFSVRSVFFV